MYQGASLHEGTARGGLCYMTGPRGADSVPGVSHSGSNFGWRALFVSAPERCGRSGIERFLAAKFFVTFFVSGFHFPMRQTGFEPMTFGSGGL